MANGSWAAVACAASVPRQSVLYHNPEMITPMSNQFIPSSPTPVLLQDKRLLIVDGDRVSATSVAVGLYRAIGIRADLVINVGDALHYLMTSPAPDLVLLDFWVGQSTSVQIATWMRQQHHLQATLRVSFSRMPPNTIRAGSDATLFAAFIVKPIAISQLAQTISQLLINDSETRR
ncbi:MAG: hypothetical protein MUD01_03405 [Chloroflexaceae bacterium]|nr:hypothetical protein [Chloroflexaceae bacterium]